MRAANVFSLDEVWNPDAAEENQLAFLEMISDGGPGPEHRLEEEELRRSLSEAG